MFKRHFAIALAIFGATPALSARPMTAGAPAINADFPDPALLRAAGGYFYVYGTQGRHGDHMDNIQIARSHDLTHWQLLPDALPTKPSWASRTQDFWAPHVSAHDGRYFLYYSAKPDAALTDKSRGLCLAVAVAARPEGPFTDSGKPLICGDGFVNIDPMAFDDPATGKRLLYWGSGFKPIKVQELAPDRTSFAPGSAPLDLLATDPSDKPSNYRRLVEGAWVTRHHGWYYLFASGDNCCGPNAHYAVMIARSRSALGPFDLVDPKHGGLVVTADARWLAPGHNSVVEDGAGRSWIAYHAVDRRRPRAAASDELNTRRVMIVKRLYWRNSLPVVRP